MVEKFDCDLAMQIAKHLAARGAGKPVGDIGTLCADASQMLLQAVCAISQQAQEKELPDSEGFWWHWCGPESLPGWKIVFLGFFTNQVGKRGDMAYLHMWSDEPHEPKPGRWIKISEPV